MNDTTQAKRSDEPVWWALFSAGGVCFAVVVPGAILALALLPAFGGISADNLSYPRISALLNDALWGLAGLAFIGSVICLPLFHAAHRIHHGLHDLKLGGGLLSKVLCYGSAAVISVVAIYLIC